MLTVSCIRTMALWGALVTGCPLAPAQEVQFPGARGDGFAFVESVKGRLQWPQKSAARVPAVLILHGSGGVDGRGEFHAQALRSAGFATLEIVMFAPG